MQWPIFSRRRRYDDLSASIQEHLEARVEELMEEGMAREGAERAARREFGNVALMEQRGREAWQWPALESLLADMKFSFRQATEPLAGICGYGAAYAGDWDWREHDCLQRGGSCAAEAAAVSGVRPPGGAVAECSGGRRG
jgi:hypothetical protein